MYSAVHQVYRYYDLGSIIFHHGTKFVLTQDDNNSTLCLPSLAGNKVEGLHSERHW